MKRSYKNFPCLEKNFCICDAQIDEIICNENMVRFVFSKGFYVVEKNKVELTSKGDIEFLDCSSDEFICYILQREPTQLGAKVYGQPISLADLANMLIEKNQKIELFLELYDFNFLHWRGTLLPHKAEGLSDNVIIETSGCFSITYSWE